MQYVIGERKTCYKRNRLEPLKIYERIYIDSLNDLYKYKSRLIEVVKRYI